MTDITFRDKIGIKGYDPKAVLIPGKLHFRGICLYPVKIYSFLFERVLIIHMAYKVFQEYINLVSPSIWLFVSLFIRPSVHPFVNF